MSADQIAGLTITQVSSLKASHLGAITPEGLGAIYVTGNRRSQLRCNLVF